MNPTGDDITAMWGQDGGEIGGGKGILFVAACPCGTAVWFVRRSQRKEV